MEKKRMLLYVEAGNIRGGIEVFADRQAAQLRTDGHQVKTIGSREEAMRENWDAWDEVIVHKCPSVDVLALFPPTKTVCYVHDHEPICPNTRAYTPLKHNCTRAGGLFPCLFCAPLCRDWKTSLRRVFSQSRRIEIMSRLGRIVVLSEFMKSRLVANGIPTDRISVEPPKVDYGTSEANERVEENVDMLFVGQLIRGKGVHLLLRAMTMMKKPRTLDVVGTGNMEATLKALAESLGVAERVRWRGFRCNPLDWMQAAKCVVVPSFWQEPYGLVAAEAVTLGRPCVAFAIGGLPEAAQGRATLVPPGDVKALAAALDA